jgi:hypothetical protein
MRYRAGERTVCIDGEMLMGRSDFVVYAVQSVDGLGKIWIPRQTPQYYPAVFTSFWIEHQLWGLNPLGYHIVNVLLHALNAILVWRLCVFLKIPGAWLIAAVFAVHPINVESVAWITERKNVLSGAFYLAAAISYLKFDDERDTRHAAGVAWRSYALSLVLFVLALLSKTVTCSLPAALILMMLWQRKRITIARVLPLIPLFVVGLILALNTAGIEREHVGADGPNFAFSMADRMLIASRGLLFYPWKILWPHPLMFIYPRWVINDASWVSYWPMAIVLIVALAAVIGYARGWRGPALALAFFAGTIVPALGFFNVYPMLRSRKGAPEKRLIAGIKNDRIKPRVGHDRYGLQQRDPVELRRLGGGQRGTKPCFNPPRDRLLGENPHGHPLQTPPGRQLIHRFHRLVHSPQHCFAPPRHRRNDCGSTRNSRTPPETRGSQAGTATVPSPPSPCPRRTSDCRTPAPSPPSRPRA